MIIVEEIPYPMSLIYRFANKKIGITHCKKQTALKIIKYCNCFKGKVKFKELSILFFYYNLTEFIIFNLLLQKNHENIVFRLTIISNYRQLVPTNFLNIFATTQK